MPDIQVRKGKRETTYKIEFMRDGSRFSRTFKNKKQAQLFQAQLLMDNNLAHVLTNQTLNNLCFCDAATQYLAQDTGKDPSKHQRLGYWSSVFTTTPVGKITRQDVKRELKILSKTRKPATLNRYKAALSALYVYLNDELDAEFNPAKGIRHYSENNGRTRFLTDNELPRLLEATAQSNWDRLYLLVLMAITTGARRTELVSLDWSKIDLKQRTAHLGETKNGQQRILTLTADVVSELMKFRQVGGFLFPKPSDPHAYFKNFDIYWRRALQEAEIDNFRFHDLRHSCASLLAMNGASLLEIAEVLGHKSIAMTQRYSHLCIGHKASLTDRVFGTLNHV